MTEDATPATDLGVAIPVRLQHQAADGSWRSSHRWALGFAVVLHAVVIWTMLPPIVEGQGGGGQQLEAIGVEIVFSDVLASREKGDAVAVASAPVAGDRTGDWAEDDAADARKQVNEPATKAGEPEPSETEPTSTSPSTLHEPPPEKVDDDPAKAAGDEVPRTAGGAAAESHAGTGEPSAAARSAAQAGAVNRFVATLRSRLARTKPRGLRIKGVAVVVFAVLPSGELDYVRVAKSSGSQALDEAAVGAVRRAAPFPAPPPWMAKAELRFSIPYRFE